jgi:hypothetical protein
VPYEISTFQLPCGARAARVKNMGTLTGEEATSMMRQWDPGGPYRGLPTLVLQEGAVLTPEARSVFAHWKDPATTEWFAIVVTNAVMRVSANFIMRVSRTTRRRMFATEAEAIQWLDARARENMAKPKEG